MKHIEMHEDYTQTTRYSGILDDEHHFTVSCDYDSSTEGYKLKKVVWTTTSINDKKKKYVTKAETKIKDFVHKWLFKRPKEEEDDVN